MAARREPRVIVAYAPCPLCGARCAHQQSVVGRVYGYCHGNDDPRGKACGGDWRFGRTHSENFIRTAKAAAAPASSPAPAEKVTHEQPARPDDAGKPAVDKPAGAGFFDRLFSGE
jgi:hypothetical protein